MTVAPAYRGNIWRLFVVQALLGFILWVPIWVVFLQGKGLSLTQVGLLEGVAWTITARIWGRTVFLSRLSRDALPGPGLPVVVTLDATRNGNGTYRLTTSSDGTYRINEIWANVR